MAASEVITTPAESSLAIRNDSGTSRCDGFENLVGQWKETSALLNKRDVIIGDLLKLIEPKAPSPDQQLLLEQEQEKSIRQLSHESTALRKRLTDLERRHQAIQDIFTGDPFVVVLLDGEMTLFNDSYVKLGADGGRQAANHLAGLIKQHLAKDDGPLEPSWRIHMHIFGSVPKLAKNYQDNGLVQNPATFNAFIKAFNRERGFFQAMDVTDQKQSADHKVKKNFELFWNNRLCKYLVLGGGSREKSYGEFLRHYTTKDEDLEKIIMLDRINFPQSMSTIAWRMASIRSPSLFHNNNIIATAANKVPTTSSSNATTKTTFSTTAAAVAPNSTALTTTKPAANLKSPVSIKGLHSRLTPPDSPLSTRTTRTAAGRNANRKLSFSHLAFKDHHHHLRTSPSPSKKSANARAKTLVSRASKHFFVKMPTLISVNPPVPPPSMALPPTPSQTSLVPSTAGLTSTAKTILPLQQHQPQICLNAAGDRIDPPGPSMRYDPVLRDDFRHRTKPLCFEHHLRQHPPNSTTTTTASSCPRGETCPSTHGPPLTNRSALETLAYLARCSPCERRGKCRDARCVRGHVCPIADGLCCPEICEFGVEGHAGEGAGVVVRRVVGEE